VSGALCAVAATAVEPALSRINRLVIYLSTSDRLSGAGCNWPVDHSAKVLVWKGLSGSSELPTGKILCD
jgi:hypothetical protein